MAKNARGMLERSGSYYARKVVPTGLRGLVGKAEMRVPLGRNRKEALLALPEALAAFESDLARAKAHVTPKPCRPFSTLKVWSVSAAADEAPERPDDANGMEVEVLPPFWSWSAKRPGLTLAAVLDLYLARAKNTIAPATIEEKHNAVRMFNEACGAELSINDIALHHIRIYVEALLETPVKYRSNFSGKTLPEAIAMNKRRARPLKTITAKTINDKYIMHLSSLFSWALKNRWAIADLRLSANPIAGVRVDGKKGTRRLPFDRFDLDKLARHDLFAAAEFEELAWAILVALYTGARAGEIAQLRLDRIRREHGVLVFEIDGEVKNESSKRLVPVHDDLIALGLEDRIETLLADGRSHLFPEWFARAMTARRRAVDKGRAERKTYADFLPSRFNDSVLRELAIDGPKRFHSFRHTFKTELQKAGVAPQDNDALTGHAGGSAGSRYVHAEPVKRMKAALDALHYPSFDALLARRAASRWQPEPLSAVAEGPLNYFFPCDIRLAPPVRREAIDPLPSFESAIADELLVSCPTSREPAVEAAAPPCPHPPSPS